MSQPKVRRTPSQVVNNTAFWVGRRARIIWDGIAEAAWRVRDQVEVAGDMREARRAGEDGVDVEPAWESKDAA